MNFLLGNTNNYDDDDDAGWEDEEDLDLSDSSPGREEEDDDDDGDDDNNNNNSNINMQLGAGMIMGRLTRLLEAVAPRLDDDDNNDDGGYDNNEQDGWQQDEDDLGDIITDDDDDDDDDKGQTGGGGGWGDDQQLLDEVDVTDNGDDGDDMDGAYAHESREVSDLNNTTLQTTPQQAVFGTPHTTTPGIDVSSGGWDDDLHLSAQLMNTSTFSLMTPPPVREPDVIIPLKGASGWDDEDEDDLLGEIEDTDLDAADHSDRNRPAIVPSVAVVAPRPLRHAPPPPPPPPPGPPQQSQSNVSDLTNGSNLMSSTAAIAPTVASTTATILTTFSGITPGWEDDAELEVELEDDDLDLHLNDVQGSRPFLTKTPSHPPPVVVEGESSLNSLPSVSFARDTSTTAAVATSMVTADLNQEEGGDVTTSKDSGWDDDDGLLDDVDVDDVDYADSPAVPNTTPSEISKMVDLTPPPPPPHQNINGTHNTLGGRTDAAVVVDDDPSLEDGWGDDDAGIDDTLDGFNDEADQDLNGGEEDIGPIGGGDKLMVDHIPPPPPPHGEVGATVDTICDYNYDDDDISRDDTLSIANSRSQQPRNSWSASSLPVVVLTEGETELVDPVVVVDRTPETDVSNSIQDGQENGEVIDGGIPAPFPRNEEELASMAVLYEEDDANSSLDNFSLRSGTGDSIASASTGGGAVSGPSAGSSIPFIGARPISSPNVASTSIGKQRRMVDRTPRSTKGTSGDASLLVAGHTSVGESLDSIDEAEDEEDEGDDGSNGEKDESGGVSQRLVKHGPKITPRTMESGWGGVLSQEATMGYARDLLSTSSPADESLGIPFGSALTPTANNNHPINQDFSSMPMLEPFATSDFGTTNNIAYNSMAVVDHTPLVPNDFHRSVAIASVDVLSDTAREDDLGESDVDVDDIKEDLYGPMVDHTPQMPNGSLVGIVSGGADSAAHLANPLGVVEDDTVVGHAEKKDVEFDIQKDDEMDDYEAECEESSRGETSTLGGMGTLGEDNRSLRSGRLPVVDETQYMVDHVPIGKSAQGTTDASTMVLMDASSASSRVEDNVDDDGTNIANFGPIVDHTPTPAHPVRGGPSIATSVVTQIDDDDMDNTTIELTGGGGGRSTGELEDPDNEQADGDHIVDHVPVRRGHRVTLDASIRVLVDKDEYMTQGDTIVEEGGVNFGPIVDHTPFTTPGGTSVGLSVGASMMVQASMSNDGKRVDGDDDLDNTLTLGGGSLDAPSGWDNDEPDLEDISSPDVDEDEANDTIGDSSAPYEDEMKNLVDHVPKRSFSKPADASTLVLFDPLDAVSEVDNNDDDTRGSARSDRFGPVVDHTPAPPSLPVSVTASMLTQANDVTNDIRQDDDMDGTWFGASTVGGISTVGASSAAAGGSSADDDDDDDDESGTGWTDDAVHVSENIASPIAHLSVQGTEGHLVDHVPVLTSPLPVGGNASMAVVVDPSVISSEAQDDTVQDEKTVEGLFGAVVDHTPSIAPVPRIGGDNSLSTLVTGIATDIKRDEEMDETTWQGGMSAQGEGWEQDDPDLEELEDENDDSMPHLVDHVPERPGSRPADPSLIVAADPSEMSSQVDDFNQDEQNFGPVVDLTPLERVIPPPAVGSTVVALPSVLNDDLDDAEGDGDEQTEEERRPPNQWEEQLPNPQSGNDDDSSREQLVDFLPPPEELPDLVRDGSSEMATVDEKSTLPADDPKEDEFGPVVDHTPPAEPTVASEMNGNNFAGGADQRKPAAIPRIMDSVAPMFSVASNEKEDGLDEDEFGPVVDQLPTGSSRGSLGPSREESTVDALATVSEVEDDLNTRDGWEDDTIDLVDQASPTATIRDDRSHSVTWVDTVFAKENGTNSNKAEQFSKLMSGSAFFGTETEMGGASASSVNETLFYDPEVGDANGWGYESLNIDSAENNMTEDDTPPSTPRASLDYRSQMTCEREECNNATTTDCPCVQALLTSNEGKGLMVGFLKTPEGGSVQVDFENLLVTEKSKRLLVEKEVDALKTKIESLKASRDQLVAASDTHIARDNEMMAAIAQWQTANAELSEDVQKFEVECDKLRNMNLIQSDELASLRKSLAQLEQEKTLIQSKEATLSIEVANLKSVVEKNATKSASDAIILNDIDKLRAELASKAKECSELNAQIYRVEEKLTHSEANSFKYAKDVAKMSKEHNQIVSQMNDQLDKHKKMLEEAQTSHESLVAELQRSLSAERAKLQLLLKEKIAVEADKKSIISQLEKLVTEHRYEMSGKESSIRRIEDQLQSIQNEKTKLLSDVARLAEQVKMFSSASSELAIVAKDRDGLREALGDSQKTIAALQNQIDDSNRMWKEVLEQQKLEVNSLQEETLKQASVAETSLITIADLSERLNIAESEKRDLRTQFDILSQSHGAVENATIFSLENEIHGLRQQLHSEKDALRTSESLHYDLSIRCSELESEVERLGIAAKEMETLRINFQSLEALKSSQDNFVNELERDLFEARRLLMSKDETVVTLMQQEESLRSAFETVQDENIGLLSKVQEMEAAIVEHESEVEDLKKRAEEKDSWLNIVNEQLQKAEGERDLFRKERGLLEEENEEMLVQFGLLKEQMDASDTELLRAQEAFQNRDRELQEERRKYLETEDKLSTLSRHLEMLNSTRNGEDDERDKIHEQLVEENTGLRDKIENLTAEATSMKHRIRILESENTGLAETIEELRAQVDDIISSSESKESELQSIICSMKAEKEMADASHKLLTKDNTVKLENLLRTMQEFETVSVDDKLRVQEMEMLCDDTQQELARTLRLLQESEATAEQLKMDLQAKARQDEVTKELEMRFCQMEQELSSARTGESWHHDETLGLRQQVAALEMELRDARALYQQPVNEPSGQGSAEIESLRKQIEALKRDQLASSTQAGAREEVIHREVHALQYQMVEKDGQIANLQQELRALGTDLSRSHQELASKEESVEKLSSELETLKSKSCEPASSRVLELTRDEAECVDQMRAQIITLAHDLEVSENRRADFIERVEKERQANADSLRRMTESVKRFYSTLNFRDT